MPVGIGKGTKKLNGFDRCCPAKAPDRRMLAQRSLIEPLYQNMSFKKIFTSKGLAFGAEHFDVKQQKLSKGDFSLLHICLTMKVSTVTSKQNSSMAFLLPLKEENRAKRTPPSTPVLVSQPSKLHSIRNRSDTWMIHKILHKRMLL